MRFNFVSFSGRAAACLGVALLAATTNTPASAADATVGEKLFKKCKVCHTIVVGKNKIGPSLAGVYGRKAGSLDGYKYSKALKASELVWDDETLDRWLTKPRKLVKKTKMAFPGFKKTEDRENVIAYLKTLP